jgi:LacI family transcriptional regulator
MIERLRIALLIESSRAYGRGLLKGIMSYAHRADWALFFQERGLSEDVPRWLRQWQGDGVIARLDSMNLVRQIKKKALPTVDLRGTHSVDGIPVIHSDQRVVAHMAADHLLERKFEHFAFCGFSGVNYGEQRCRHFVEYVRDAGYDVSVYDSPSGGAGATTSSIESKGLLAEHSLASWLRSLPKPVGLMASNDIRARQVLSICTDRAISVPDEIAVIGVDNDELLCELSNPSLSSVVPDTATIGYNAAALIERMIGGAEPPNEAPPVKPLGIVTRRSTDVVAIADADVATAIRFIRERACDGITISDVLSHVQVSRSTLHRRFQSYVGRSAKQEIQRVRVQRAAYLLRTTDCSLAEISELTGFGYAANLSQAFRNDMGRTPGRYRMETKARK